MYLIENYDKQLKDLCKTYQVDKLYLFGSILSSDFKQDSDIDFLVRFKNIELYKYFDNYMNFKNRLKMLLGREIDLVEEQSLKNPILKKSIEKSKKLIYG